MFSRSIRFVVTLLIVGLATVGAQSAYAQSTTADVVWGQGGSFTASGTNDGGISANSVNGPYGIVTDSGGNLYMADTGNSRVLFFPAGTTTATVVYGHMGSFTSNTPNDGGISANSLSEPYKLTLDSSNNLYVVDTNNNRVLFYPYGSTTSTRVYGQFGSFTTNASNAGTVTANTLYNPTGVVVDSSGNVYISDYYNNRVLFYPSGSTTATRVYGQGGSFTTNTPNKGGVSANSLYNPEGLMLDSSGNLYIADYNNSRVLFYPAGSTTATRVYGQLGSFTTNLANNGGVSATSLNDPTDMALDSRGDLYIVDNRNHRVLFYLVGNTIATQVYGQFGSLTSNTPVNGGVTANSLYYPWGMTLDGSNNVYIADSGANRVLGYPPMSMALYYPPNASSLLGNSVTFQWTGYLGATAYWLDVGKEPGGNEYYQSQSLSPSTYSATVNSLPSDGSTVYATWYYLLNGSWVSNEYSYTAFGAPSQRGVIVSPVPGTTLPGSSVTFTWTAGSGATAYWIDAGYTAGGNQWFQSGNIGNVLSKTVTNLPLNHNTVFITLYSLVNGQWLNNQYFYTAFDASDGLAAMISPTPGSTLNGNVAIFTWSSDPNATAYWMDVGSTAGGNQYFQSGSLGLTTSTTVYSLPANNSLIYVTLYSQVAGQWYFNQYTYTSGP